MRRMRTTGVSTMMLLAVTLAAAPTFAQQPPRAWIPGLPVPVYLPPGFPLGNPQVGLPPVTNGGQPVGTGQPVRPAPPGSFDGGGFLTLDYMRGEAKVVLDSIVANLAADRRAKVNGIPLSINPQDPDVNAYAGCDNGNAYMAITLPLLRAMGHIAEAKASDEIFGTSRVDTYTRSAAAALGNNQPVPDPPPGFYAPAEAMDARKLERQAEIFDEQTAFVLGHELGHHYLGHTGCANGAATGILDPAAIGRLLSNTVPGFNQPNEVAADTVGTQSLLDTGAARAVQNQYAWTEAGALLVLNFFSTMQALDAGSLALGFLNTHPPPQFRVPIVQSVAAQWRAAKAAGRSTATPFPFPLPF